jgi:ribosomal protein S18 acetylase RimI-like enzyme
MSSAPGPALEYRLFRPSDADAVTEVLADVFSRHDPLAYAAHVTRDEFAHFVRCLLPQAAQDDLTLLACLPATGQVVGVMLSNDGAADSPEELSQLNEKFEPIAGILGALDDLYLAGQKPAPGQMLHLYLVGVLDSHAGQGIAQQLILRALEHGVRKGYTSAFAESTNRRSQHVFRKLGFAERAQILYGDFLFHGQPFFAGIASHGGPILMEKAISPAS